MLIDIKQALRAPKRGAGPLIVRHEELMRNHGEYRDMAVRQMLAMESEAPRRGLFAWG